MLYLCSKKIIVLHKSFYFMKKFFIAALCVGLFVTANSVSAQQNTKVQPKPKVENAVKKATATTTTTVTPKACCVDKQACCDAAKATEKTTCCATKAGDKIATCTTVNKKVACTNADQKPACSANNVVTANNKSSGKK